MLNSFSRQNVNRYRGRGWSMPMVLVAAVVVVAGTAGVVHGQGQYSVEQIVGPGCAPFGSPTPLIATGLNNYGEVVGHYADCSNENRHPFYWSEQTGLMTLPFADGAVSARPYDINDNQQIVGEHRIPGVGWRGFMYDMNTGEFHFLEPKFGVGMAVVNAINNAGIAVGARSITKAGNNPHNAVIWDTNTGEITDLGLIWGPNSTARNISDDGDWVVGWTGFGVTTNRAFVSQNGKIEILPPIPDGASSDASDVTSHGMVVGSGQIGNTWRGFIWMNGSFVEVVNPPKGFSHAGASHVNEVDQIFVGCTTSTGLQAPFLMQHGNMHNINDLIESTVTLNSNGGRINEFGQILTRASTRGALLTPVDVPLGDLDLDCRVDGHDLMILLESWGPVPRGARSARGSNTSPNADLNGDGVVDGADLLILLSNWTF